MKMTAVGCGKAGRLFGWGLAANNSLPGAKTMDSDNHVCFPEHLLPEKMFVQICADVGLFAALTSNGELISWGSERMGFSSEPIPCCVDIDHNVKTDQMRRQQVFSQIAVNEASVFGIDKNTAEVYEFDKSFFWLQQV